MGLQGGFDATYNTVAGDTFQTVFDALQPQLVANGIDAYIAGNALDIVQTIPDNGSVDGAVLASWSDPGLQFEFSGQFNYDSGSLPAWPSLASVPSACWPTQDGGEWQRRRASQPTIW